MKKLFCISVFLCVSTPIVAQDFIEKAYFHELKGMEDSVGVTHLFYRFYDRSLHQCAPGNDNDIVVNIRNDVYHLNTSNSKNTIKFRDGFVEWCLAGMYDSQGVYSYDFYANDPNKWIAISYFEYVSGISDYLENDINTHTPIAVKRNQSSDFYYSRIEEFYISPNNDSLYTFAGKTIPFAGHGDLWPEFETHEEFISYADSVSFDLKILAIHPNIDSLYFALDRRNFLYKSEHYTGNFTLADSSGSFYRLAFDADSSSIYAIITKKQGTDYNRYFLKSNDVGNYGTWNQLTLPDTDSRFEFIETDSKQSGNVYVADSNNVYSSINFGTSFDSILSSEDLIAGLYKKPNSDILYVLTKKELLEVNTETKQTTTLKEIPVSNEPEPTEIPNQISLLQNYPNPFNPSTVIIYQLTRNIVVQLEVFDVTGRKVAVLVDGERKSAGKHQVTFEASGLSSGVYLYRLETGGQTLTQKMLLVK